MRMHKKIEKKIIIEDIGCHDHTLLGIAGSVFQD